MVEIASKEFMDNLVSILKYPGLNHEVKQKILRLVQNWSISFEGKPSLSYVSQIYKSLKNEGAQPAAHRDRSDPFTLGFSFPPPDAVATSSAMIDTSTAPEWIDSDVCMRCRTAFSFTNRKHHCRNCGQVFDQQCSAKILPLPHFGIAQEVRVCDSCYVKVTKNRDKSYVFELIKQHPANIVAAAIPRDTGIPRARPTLATAVLGNWPMQNFSVQFNFLLRRPV